MSMLLGRRGDHHHARRIPLYYLVGDKNVPKIQVDEIKKIPHRGAKSLFLFCVSLSLFMCVLFVFVSKQL